MSTILSLRLRQTNLYAYLSNATTKRGGVRFHLSIERFHPGGLIGSTPDLKGTAFDGTSKGKLAERAGWHEVLSERGYSVGQLATKLTAMRREGWRVEEPEGF